jgi:hypothetical protein
LTTKKNLSILNVWPEREVLLAVKISSPWEEMPVLRHCRAHIDVPDKQLSKFENDNSGIAANVLFS